ncbi:hypothetical protein T458_00255 [Brevibacillus panacihumi W25]|uniref:Uncharacterized protein n=1 Tax=Brevibacillus panacihumi W25 TaxID=1408254 RepID=V6MFM9_9BACL|nr:hypothetical protein [Brevibacillus panacihumi]EST56720.1 hypothetical protein T458_00255 [Brevibacillus panacihumi W25]
MTSSVVHAVKNRIHYINDQEAAKTFGTIIESDIAVTHAPIHRDSCRNLRIYEKRMAAGEQFTPRGLFYYANELKDHRIFDRAIHYYETFLQTKQGWIEDNIAACEKPAPHFRFEEGDILQMGEEVQFDIVYTSNILRIFRARCRS